MAHAPTDLLMVRHPTQRKTFLNVASREEVRRTVALSAEPRVVVVYSGPSIDQETLLRDLASAFGISLPSEKPLRTSTLLLAPSAVSPQSILAADAAWIGDIAALHEYDAGTVDRRWNRDKVDSRSYLRSLLNVAAREHEEDTMGAFLSSMLKIVDEDNCSSVRSQVARAEQILDATRQDVTGVALDLLWHTRTSLRAVQELVSKRPSERVELGRTLENGIRDLDGISLLFSTQSIRDLMIQSQQAARERLQDAKLDRKGQVRVETQLHRVNRRFTVIGVALLLPGLWLAYWATPSAPSKIVNHPMASPFGQALLVAAAFLLALAGMGVGMLVSRHDALKETE